MSKQSEYQAQITKGLENTDDDAILTLSPEDLPDRDSGEQDNYKEVIDTEEFEESEESEEPEESEEIEEDVADSSPKEEVYTKDQVQSIVRTRVANYEKRISKYKQSEEALERIAEVSGLTKEQLVTRLNSMSDAEQAQVLGIQPEQVAAMRAQKMAKMESEKQIKKLNRELELTHLKSDKKYSDIDLFLEDVLAKVEDHPSLSLKDAYTLVKGELGLTATIRDAEQRVANSQAVTKKKKLVDSIGGSAETPKKISTDTVNNAKRVEMDPNSYEAYKQIDNIDAYRAYKKAQKGAK